MKFIKYIMNYKSITAQIEQLKSNLENIHGKKDFQLVMARAAVIDLNNSIQISITDLP